MSHHLFNQFLWFLPLNISYPVLTRNRMQYSVGTITIVSIVPNVSPAMIVTAIPIQKTSCSKGMTPSTVPNRSSFLSSYQSFVYAWSSLDSISLIFLTTPAPASVAAASSGGSGPGLVVALAPLIAPLPGLVTSVEVPGFI